MSGAATSIGASTSTAARANPLRRRDFRLFWSGQAVSSIGDQFAIVALPWLALILTGSALALGSVLAMMAVPRAALMLFGGVYVDRLSPRRVMVASNAVRLISVTILAVIVLAGAVTMPVLYLFALVFGIADAFFYPAQQAIIPAIVGSDEIATANAITQGTTQLSVFLGPAVAGVAIAALGTSGVNPSLTGVGFALLVDAATFVVSLVTLAFMRATRATGSAKEPVLSALKAGLSFVWHWPTLLAVVLMAMAVNLLIVGPLGVGLPVVAYTKLPEGAAAYGVIMSAMGAGALLGMVAVVALPKPRPARLGPFVVGLIGLSGLAVAGLALVTLTLAAAILAAISGFATGYANLMLITWAQQRIPARLMGRVFSLILFGSMALIPVSQVVAGALVAIDLELTLIGAGMTMALLMVIVLTAPIVRRMGLEPVPADDGAGGPVDGSVAATR